MKKEKSTKIVFDRWLVIIIVSTIASIGVSVYCLKYGWNILYPNLYYIPIVIACVSYFKKGLIFSVSLVVGYFFLSLFFTHDPSVLVQTIVRVIIFIIIASIVEHFANAKRAWEINSLRINKRLQIISEATKDGIILIDDNGNVIYWNNGAETIFGYRKSEAMNRNLHELIAPERFHLAFRKGFEKFQKTGKGEAVGKTLELFGIRKDREEFPLELSLSAIEVDGKWQSIGVIRDITDRKKLENEKNQQLDALREMGKVAKVGGWSLEIKTGVSSWTEGVFEIFEINQSDLSPPLKESLDLYSSSSSSSSSSREIIDLAVKRAIQFGEAYDLELEIVTKRGNHRWVHTTGKANWENGKIVSISGAIQDITERKNAEKCLIESERLNAIGELAAGVAHDFNNTLQAVIGYTELALMNSNNPPETVDCLEEIEVSCRNATDRVRKLQRFSQKNSNIEMDKSLLNLNDLLEEVVSQAKVLWKNIPGRAEKTIYVQKHYGQKIFIEGIWGEIFNVFYNLIKNAVEAMPNGGIITLKTEIVEEKVLVSISDTGMGMDEETKKRIFQPFFSTKDQFNQKEGRGLGLSSVHRIILDHSGELFVKETVLGVGTTMGVALPLKMMAENSLEKLEKKEAVVPRVDSSVRVLWVDDEESIVDFGKRTLKHFGYSAYVTSGGEEALALLEKNVCDVLITDMGMPQMNGLQLARLVRDKYPEMKIILLSGWDMNFSEKEKLEKGIDLACVKPITAKELKNIIDKVMRLKA